MFVACTGCMDNYFCHAMYCFNAWSVMAGMDLADTDQDHTCPHK